MLNSSCLLFLTLAPFLQDATQPANADSGSHQQRHLAAFPVQHGNLSKHVGAPCSDTHTHIHTRLHGAELLLLPPAQIHAGAADHRPFIFHAAGQLQRRPRALAGLYIPYNDPTQQFHHQPVPLRLPHAASGFPALPAAAAAAALLSGKSCCGVN